MSYAENLNPDDRGVPKSASTDKEQNRHAIISVSIALGVICLVGFSGVTLVLSIFT